MKKTLLFNQLFREKNYKEINIIVDKEKYDITKPYGVKRYLKKYYKISKTYFFENPDEN